jgi:hypothetical protein
VGKGVELFGKVKMIDEQDDRMTDPRFLPYNADGSVRFYSPGNSSSSVYFAPPIITVNGVTGPQWKPFTDVSDDDRDMDYKMFQLGAGYQLTDNLYGSLTYEKYDIDLQDGNTAFQAYQLHNMSSGQHDKNKLILAGRYVIGGAEFGASYEYNWGEFDPDFGGGFVTQFADADTAKNFGVPEGSPGFRGRFGGWNSLIDREFKQQRTKVFMKVRF